MAGTTQAPQAFFAFLVSPHHVHSLLSGHLTISQLRMTEISLPSGVVGTEMLNLHPQGAHSLKCSVLTSLSIWALCSLDTALKKSNKAFSNHYPEQDITRYCY